MNIKQEGWMKEGMKEGMKDGKMEERKGEWWIVGWMDGWKKKEGSKKCGLIKGEWRKMEGCKEG